MSEIDTLQGRISAALERISTGLDHMQAARLGATASLEQALQDAQQTQAGLSAQLDSARGSLGALEADVQRLRQLTMELSDACEALREANAAGVGDAHLINTAMATELATLRAARKAEMTQADTILIALAPLLDPNKEQA